MARITIAALLLLGVAGSAAFTPLQRVRQNCRLVMSATGTDGSEAVPPTSLPMSEMELAEQSAKLDALAAKWRRRQQEQEDDAAKRSGWAASSEQINGRFAMFFLIVGLVTEYYTGESVPQQVYTMFQTLGLVD